MSDYTIEMFRKDQVETESILKFLDAVQLPEEEWPKFNVDGKIYSVNPNFREADLAGFFIARYGKLKGTDYVARFLMTRWFIHEHHKDLERKKMVRHNDRRQLEMKEELLKVILESFTPAQVPSIFPQSTLAGKNNRLDYKKVIKAVEPLLKTRHRARID